MYVRGILIGAAALGLALGVMAVAGTRIDAQGAGAATVSDSTPEPVPQEPNLAQAKQQGPQAQNPDRNDNAGTAPPQELSVPQVGQHAKVPDRITHTATSRFCNKSGVAKIWLAQVYWDVARNGYTTEGWWGLNNGSCLTFERSLGQYTNSSVWYHAWGGDFRWWNASRADGNYCAPPGAVFKTGTPAPSCNAADLVGFKKMPVTAGRMAQADFTR